MNICLFMLYLKAVTLTNSKILKKNYHRTPQWYESWFSCQPGGCLKIRQLEAFFGNKGSWKSNKRKLLKKFNTKNRMALTELEKLDRKVAAPKENDDDKCTQQEASTKKWYEF